MTYIQKPPVSKRELINRLLSHDFDGDLRHLGEGARISRVDANTVEVRFDKINRTFLLSAHIPRDPTLADDGFSSPMPGTRKSNSSQ